MGAKTIGKCVFESEVDRIKMKIETILDQIDLGNMALPEFQRGYVWNRDHVRGLVHSF